MYHINSNTKVSKKFQYQEVKLPEIPSKIF